MGKPNRKETIVAEKPHPCPECIHYSVCTALCDKVELWVNQDSVGVISDKVILENGRQPNKTFLLGAPDDFLDLASIYSGSNSWSGERDAISAREAWEEFSTLNLSEKTVEFVDLYYRQGKRIRDIAIELGITSSAADRRHQQAKASIKRRLRRRKIWIDVLRDGYKFLNQLHYDICQLVFDEFLLQREVAERLDIHPAQVSKVVAGTVRDLIKKGLIEDTGKRI